MTLAHAAQLLAAGRSVDALAPLVRAAGIAHPTTKLPRAARDTLAAALGPDTAVLQARVATGPHPLHALVADVAGPPLRSTTARLAAHLAAAGGDRLWLLALRHAADGTSALAAWHLGPRGTPRIAALQFHPDAVTPSDADTLRALAARAAAAPTPLLTHTAWLDALGRDTLGARFYHTLERSVAALASSLPAAVADPAARTDLALLTATRLLFLAFLEAKGWLDGDPAFLTRHYDAAIAAGGHVHRRTLRPLFFGTLNTPRRHRAPTARAFGRVPFLNGGLFAPTPLERRHRHPACGDEPLGAFIHTLLAGHRFTAHEDASSWSEAAVDPEMLGRAFESLMYARQRHTTGAFYTPRPLVEHATTEALVAVLSAAPAGHPQVALDGAPATLPAHTVAAALAGTVPDAPLARQLHARATALRLLDPACGSGAFLVHALERLADLLATCGDRRPLADRRHAVLTRSLFGVDVNPTAVWLCELRLWLSVVVERDIADPLAAPPLPNLDHNIRVGDALAVAPGLEPLTHHTWGGAPWGSVTATAATAASAATARRHHPAHLAALRARYATLAGPRKLAAARRLDAGERACALAALDRALASVRHARADALAAARTPDLFGQRHRPAAAARAHLAALRVAARTLAARRRTVAAGAALPFGFAWHFADVAADAGFDLLLGNPPWVRPHAVDPDTRAALRAHYACARAPAWSEGARLAHAGPGFGHQIDLAALFTERALALTRPGGVTAFLLPAKLWRTLAGGGLRDLVLRESTLLTLDDWSDAPAAFDAAVYPSLLVTRRRPAAAPAPNALPRDARPTRGRPDAPAPGNEPPPRAPATAAVRVHRGRTVTAVDLPPAALPLDGTAPASPWLLLPHEARRAFDALRAAGPALAHTALPRPTLGVKCGCNHAFLVEPALLSPDPGRAAADPALAHVRQGDRVGLVERALLRPALRGEHLARPADAPHAAPEYLIWPYDHTGRLLTTLPPHAARWLAPHRAQLARRSDARGTTPWWRLFRTDAAAADHPRVVWPDLARTPRPRVLPAGDPHVPLNTCYAAVFDTLDDATAFAALLAAPPVAAWLAALAEPARGGYRRFLAWTVALLPIPRAWSTARALLAPLGPSAPPDALTEATAAAYGVARGALTPLLDWVAAPTPDSPTPEPPTPSPSAPPPHSPPPRHVREPAWAAQPPARPRRTPARRP